MDLDTDTLRNDFSIERDAFLPVLLLGLSLLLFFISQVTDLSSQRTTIMTAIQRQDDVVKQSRQVQGKLQSLALDLLETAKTDEAAQKIVGKYNIRQNPPPGPL